MTQTAVDWLVNELPQIDWSDPYWKLILEETKIMEKEQILEAASNESIFKIVEYWLTEEKSNLSLFEWRLKIKTHAERYYNETYGE